jgi:hypothetical protein
VNVVSRHLWQKNFNIQFDFRTFYPNGVLLAAPVSLIALQTLKVVHKFILNLLGNKRKAKTFYRAGPS